MNDLQTIAVDAATTTGAAALAAGPPGPERSAPPVVELLPRFSLHHEGAELALTSRAERIVCFLAVEGGPVRRSVLAGTLWPEVTSDRAFASLRSALWSLPRMDPPLITATARSVALGAHVQTDLGTAIKEARRLVTDPADVTDPAASLRLLGHGLLVEWAEEWILIEQERFRQLRMHALEALCRELSRQGRHALAVEAGLQAVACEPLRESAHCLLMAAHLEEGNRCEAINQYRMCARLLHEELALEPSAPMRAMLRRATAPEIDLRDAVVTTG